MKLGTPFYVLLTLAFVFTCVGLIIVEFRTNYLEAGVPETSYDKYNYITNMTISIEKIRVAADKVGGTEGWRGFLVGLVASSVIFFLGLIITIGQLIISIFFFNNILFEIGREFGIPDTLIFIVSTSITAGIVIMIVKFVHKGQS